MWNFKGTLWFVLCRPVAIFGTIFLAHPHVCQGTTTHCVHQMKINWLQWLDKWISILNIHMHMWYVNKTKATTDNDNNDNNSDNNCLYCKLQIKLRTTKYGSGGVRSRNCGRLVTWFCYQLIAKPGNKTATVPCPDPYIYLYIYIYIYIYMSHIYKTTEQRY